MCWNPFHIWGHPTKFGDRQPTRTERKQLSRVPWTNSQATIAYQAAPCLALNAEVVEQTVVSAFFTGGPTLLVSCMVWILVCGIVESFVSWAVLCDKKIPFEENWPTWVSWVVFHNQRHQGKSTEIRCTFMDRLGRHPLCRLHYLGCPQSR